MAYKITAVCRAGVGTSAFAKKLIETAVTELGYNKRQFIIDCNEVMFARGIREGIIVTQKTLLKSLPEPSGKLDAIIGLDSIVKDVEALKTQLKPVLEKAEAEGKIKKG